MKKLALLLPTNDKKTFDSIFMRSVSNLKFVADKILFAINFQKPFSKFEAKTRVKKLRKMGFEVRYVYNEYRYERSGMIPFNQIRYDCATLCPEIEFYALCDDDFEFARDSDLMVQNILEVFEKYPRLGVIQCTHRPLFVPKVYQWKNPSIHNFYTDNGFFFRNINKEDKNVLVYPKQALECVGACEEFIIGLELAKHDYEVYLRTYSSILHHRRILSNGDSPYHWGGDEILLSKNGIFTFINEYYKDILNREVSYDNKGNIK